MPVGGRRLSVEEALALSYKVGFRTGPLKVAVALMAAESGRYVEAYNINPGENASLDRGLFQINTVHSSLGMAAAFNAVANARFAYELSHQGSNFSPWSAYNSGAYEKHFAEVKRVFLADEWRKLIPTILEDLA